MDNQIVLVIGSGTMGQGIAQVSATAGYKTYLFDLDSDKAKAALEGIAKQLKALVEKGKLSQDQADSALKRLHLVSALEDASDATLVIEAIVELLEVKQMLFIQLESVLSPKAVLASNTSSLSVSAIAKMCQRPEQVCGIHFFNPAPIMKLVEVVQGTLTSAETIDAAISWVKSVGKTTVLCQDAPGFIVNRVARPFYTESLKALEDGVADIATIDACLTDAGFKMGPFTLMDLIGQDINFAVTNSLYTAFQQEPRFRPSRIQGQKVANNHLGRKTKRGFYTYE